MVHLKLVSRVSAACLTVLSSMCLSIDTPNPALPANSRGTRVTFERKLSGKLMGIRVECARADKSPDESICDRATTQMDGAVILEKVSANKVQEVIHRFFHRLDSTPSAEFRKVASDEAYLPESSTYIFRLTTPSRNVYVGFSMDDVDGLKLERKELLSLVRYIEIELSRIAVIR